MASKYITLEYHEYLNVYRYWKSILNPSDQIFPPWSLSWGMIGLEYYDSLPKNKRRFKILDHSKWMQHWMLVKISN